jgi:transglutaminase-like putative cysteine protease
MKFDTYFRLTSYALIASAFLAMAMTGEVDALSVLLYSAAFLAAFYLDSKQVKKWRPREWAWRLLTAFYVPFMLVDSVYFSNRILALVHLSLFASAVKLFQDKVDRDWVFLYLIAFFQMLLASGLTFNATFVASLIAFVFFFITTLAAFEIRRTRRNIEQSKEETITRLKPKADRRPAKESSAAHQSPRIGRVRYLLSASILQVIIVGVLAFPLFFMIPRFNSANLASNLGEGETLGTGFSNTVELGQVASIKERHGIVMRVKLSKRPGKFIRWRGIALENYNGKAWSLVPIADRYNGNIQNRKSNIEEEQEDANFERAFYLNPPLYEQPIREDILEQRIILEPLSTTILFAARGVKSVKVRTVSIKQDKYSGALSTTGGRGRFQYSVVSNISEPNDDELRASNSNDYPEELARIYLQKPEGFDPRIRRLAQDVTRSAKTNYDRALAIQNYLKTELHYTLDLKNAGPDPLAAFLFETKEGHCEYFATAMAMMLRSIGIPARIVNGFQMGEYNSLNDLYTVRESDAHSWVEVYFPHGEVAAALSANAVAQGVSTLTPREGNLRGKGNWVEFDPTPSAGINDYSQGGLRASIRKYMDAMEVFWLDYVVTLDRDEQASLMVEIQHRLMQIKTAALGYYKGLRAWFKNLIQYLAGTPQMNSLAMVRLSGMLVILALAAALILMALAYRKRKRLTPTGYNPWWYRWFIAPILRRMRFRKRDHRASMILFYEQMLAIAAKAGLIKSPDQTPMEFALASGYAQIREITSLYNRVRFGNAQLDEREVRRISELLGNLKQAIQRK